MVLYITTNIHFVSYLAHFLLEWEMVQTKIVDKIKTHILCSSNFFSKIMPWDNVEKYCRVGQAANDNTAHAQCMLDTLDTHSGCVILIAFPLQQWFAWMHLNTLYLQCLSCMFMSLASLSLGPFIVNFTFWKSKGSPEAKAGEKQVFQCNRFFSLNCLRELLFWRTQCLGQS